MHREILYPKPPLSHFVEMLWYYRNDPQPHQKERLMPDGCASLVMNLAEDVIRLYDAEDTKKVNLFGRSVFSGPRSECMAIDTDEQVCVAGVSFRAGGAVPFLRLPADEVQNLTLNLHVLWGRLAEELRDRVMSAPAPREKLRAMEMVLLQKAAGMLEPHQALEYAVTNILMAPETTRIAKVANETGFSSRRLIELFKYHVGLPPKLFCRVRRFQRVLMQITAGRPVNWTGVALDCGYFDQAHFIHDFRRFSGINPSKYLRDHSGFPGHHNHLPILG